MKKVIVLLFVLSCIFFNVEFAFAHQLIFSDGQNTDMENSLSIPDPQISWAMYGELENNVLFYKFVADEKEPIYVSLVIPALDGLEEFSPSIAVITEQENMGPIILNTNEKNTSIPFGLPEGYTGIVFDYDGKFSNNVSYEPFTQVNYWERQEIRIDSVNPGTYYLAVFDTSENGKFTLAVGEVEDFSKANFFDSFVRAWFETKIFFGDYITAFASIVITVTIFLAIGYGIFRTVRRIIKKNQR